MNTQEAYEAIREYFSQPGATLARTNGDEGICKYRTPDWKKCAVGCLIPDNEYDPQMEGSNFNSGWLAAYPYFAGMLHGVDKNFLRSAQVLHDQVARNAMAFVAGLDLLATAYGLDAHASRGIFV